MNPKRYSDLQEKKQVPHQKTEVNILPWFILSIVFVICFWLFNLYYLKDLSSEKRGTFGDMFGFANSLFSGLAFVGIIITILLQRNELMLQRKELSETRDVFNLQRFENTFFHLISLHHQIVDEILTTLDAQHLKDRLFSTMSGGEQQRIHFARVLAQIWDQENPCLFLDEPTSALDLKQQLRILELAKKLVQERGYSLCMILHDLNMARHYADRVLLLKDGNISAYGEVKDVLVTQKIAHTFDITFEYADKYACR